MPEKSFFCKYNFDRLETTLQKIIDDLYTDGFENPIVMDRVVMDDCYNAAEQSVGFYNLEPGDISYYKELSHIAHWVARLKPFRLENPFGLLETAQSFGRDISEQLKGLKLREEAITSDLGFAINEYLAFFLATSSISACQRDEIAAKVNEELRATYLERLELAGSRSANLQNDIITSMRYHSYSARGFAMTIEGITRIAEI